MNKKTKTNQAAKHIAKRNEALTNKKPPIPNWTKLSIVRHLAGSNKPVIVRDNNSIIHWQWETLKSNWCSPLLCLVAQLYDSNRSMVLSISDPINCPNLWRHRLHLWLRIKRYGDRSPLGKKQSEAVFSLHPENTRLFWWFRVVGSLFPRFHGMVIPVFWITNGGCERLPLISLHKIIVRSISVSQSVVQHGQG
jgi:hypothetical protein